MIKTVVHEHHWTPETINGLHLDGIDHFGLEWWHNAISEMVAKLKKKK